MSEKSLYEDAVEAGLDYDSHESDLYVLDTPEARVLVEKHGFYFEAFVSTADGRRWIDVPFAYYPWWSTRQKARGN